MQTQAIFHVMPPSSEEHNLLFYACVQSALYYRQQQKVFVLAKNQQQAHQFDELLWQFDADSFVPHNLVGEGPKQGSPVEIGWQPPRGRRQVLINLTSEMPNFAGQYTQVIDFVPTSEADKQLARDRFRACRQMGFIVDTVTVEETN